MAAPDPIHVVGRSLGPYRAAALVGRGTTGKVYHGHGAPPGEVALKVIERELSSDPQTRQQVRLEAERTRQLESPFCARCYETGDDPLVPDSPYGDERFVYLAMEWLAGGALEAYRQKQPGRVLSARDVVRVGLDIARALVDLWSHSIIHLDIKPANIVAATSPAQRWPDPPAVLWKLIDLGAAQVPTTLDNDIPIGTPLYMAPEQFRSLAVQGNAWDRAWGVDEKGIPPIDGRTDVFGLGMTFYRLLTNRSPFADDPRKTTMLGVLMHCLSALATASAPAPIEPPPRDEAERRLHALILRMVERDIRARPNAGVVLAELEEIWAAMAVEPAAAAPAAPSRRTGEETIEATAAEPGLVGRDELLERLDLLARSAAEGRGCVGLVSGPRGVGTTRLLEAAARRLGPRARVVSAACSPTEPASFPVSLLRSLLWPDGAPDAHGLRASVVRLSGAQGAGLTVEVLERLLLGGPGSGLAGATSASRVPLATLAGLVAAAARERPPLVVIARDLWAADEAAGAFLRELGRVAAEAPLLLLVEAPDDLEVEAIDELSTSPLAEWLVVPRLGAADLQAIVRAEAGPPPLPDEVAALLTERATGLPKVALEALRLARERGALALAGAAWVYEPDGLRGLLAEARRSALSPRVRHDPGAPAVAAAPSSPEPGPPPSGPAVAPRSAAADEVRRGLESARHLRALSVNQEAAALLREAVALALRSRGEVPPALAAEAVLELLRVLRLSGVDLERSLPVAADGLSRAAEAERPDLVAALAVEHAWALNLLRRAAEAKPLLEQAAASLALLRDRPEHLPVIAEALHARGGVLSSLSRLPEHRAWADEADRSLVRAADLASRLGDKALFAQVCQTRGDHLMRQATAEDGLARAEALLARSRRLKLELGDQSGLAMTYGSFARLAERRWTLGGGAPEGQDHLRAAIDYYERDLEIADRIGDWRGVGVVCNSAAALLEELARLASSDAARSDLLDRAERRLRQAREAARQTRNTFDAAVSCFYVGRFLRRSRGDLARAEPELARAAELLERQWQEAKQAHPQDPTRATKPRELREAEEELGRVRSGSAAWE